MLPTLLLLVPGPPSAPQEPAGVPPVPELRLEDLELWRQRIHPAPGERSYEVIPWLPTFADGVRRANEERKPLLFWAMNGHPLGCT